MRGARGGALPKSRGPGGEHTQVPIFQARGSVVPSSEPPNKAGGVGEFFRPPGVERGGVESPAPIFSAFFVSVGCDGCRVNSWSNVLQTLGVRRRPGSREAVPGAVEPTASRLSALTVVNLFGRNSCAAKGCTLKCLLAACPHGPPFWNPGRKESSSLMIQGSCTEFRWRVTGRCPNPMCLCSHGENGGGNVEGDRPYPVVFSVHTVHLWVLFPVHTCWTFALPGKQKKSKFELLLLEDVLEQFFDA